MLKIKINLRIKIKNLKKKLNELFLRIREEVRIKLEKNFTSFVNEKKKKIISVSYFLVNINCVFV